MGLRLMRACLGLKPDNPVISKPSPHSCCYTHQTVDCIPRGQSKDLIQERNFWGLLRLVPPKYLCYLDLCELFRWHRSKYTCKSDSAILTLGYAGRRLSRLGVSQSAVKHFCATPVGCQASTQTYAGLFTPP